MRIRSVFIRNTSAAIQGRKKRHVLTLNETCSIEMMCEKGRAWVKSKECRDFFIH